MATSLIGGLVQSGVPANQILVSEPRDGAREQIVQRFGVCVFTENQRVAEVAEILVLAVKPQVMRDALDSISPSVGGRSILFISIAAGITVSSLEAGLGGSPRIVRAMPNTPALVGAGISGLFANRAASASDKEHANLILQAVGKTVWLPEEKLLDAVTAISGSGPAYFFYMLEALQAAAEAEGLDPKTARLLTIETALGASQLALAASESVATLRKQVTSPGGTTEAALNVLQSKDVFDAYVRAVAAARRRADELSTELRPTNEATT